MHCFSGRLVVATALRGIGSTVTVTSITVVCMSVIVMAGPLGTGLLHVERADAAEGISAVEFTLRTDAGQSRSGKLIDGDGNSPQFVDRDSGALIPFDKLERIEVLRDSAHASTSRLPRRRFQLVDGETLSGELIGFEGDTVRVRTLGGDILTIPRGFLHSIWNCDGQCDVFYEDFEAELAGHVVDLPREPLASEFPSDAPASQHALRLPPGRRTRFQIPLRPPIDSGRFQFALLDPGFSEMADRDRSDPETISMTLVFRSSDEMSRLEFHFSTNEQTYAVDAGTHRVTSRQSVARSAGWHQVVFVFDEHRNYVSLDGMLLATGPPIAGQLVRLVIQRSSSTSSAVIGTPAVLPNASAIPPVKSRPVVPKHVDDASVDVGSSGVANIPSKPAPGAVADPSTRSVWMDDLWLTQVRALPTPRPLTDHQDMLLLLNGDELFGRVQRITPQVVRMSASYGKVAVGWNKVAGVQWNSAIQPTVRAIEGNVVRVRLRSERSRPPQPADWLIAAFQGSDNEVLRFAHPLLGEFGLHWATIRDLEPIFSGEYRLLDARDHHLGDELRDDFRCPLPEGPNVTWSFESKTQPADAIVFSIDVDELEPAGPGTPTESPYLNQLRSGHLVTAVYLNGTPIGDLNRHIRYRRGLDDGWQRIRITLPTKLVREGQNDLSLKQRPLQNDPEDYDDFEMRRPTLEFGIPGTGE